MKPVFEGVCNTGSQVREMMSLEVYFPRKAEAWLGEAAKSLCPFLSEVSSDVQKGLCNIRDAPLLRRRQTRGIPGARRGVFIR